MLLNNPISDRTVCFRFHAGEAKAPVSGLNSAVWRPGVNYRPKHHSCKLAGRQTIRLNLDESNSDQVRCSVARRVDRAALDAAVLDLRLARSGRPEQAPLRRASRGGHGSCVTARGGCSGGGEDASDALRLDIAGALQRPAVAAGLRTLRVASRLRRCSVHSSADPANLMHGNSRAPSGCSRLSGRRGVPS